MHIFLSVLAAMIVFNWVIKIPGWWRNRRATRDANARLICGACRRDLNHCRCRR